VEEERSRNRRCVVLATGDPLCHGIAGLLIRRLGADSVEILPAPSTLQLAFARFKRPWQDYVIASAHGRDDGEWHPAAGPGHGLYPVLMRLTEHPRVALFTSPMNGPDRIARALLTAGLAEGARLSVACRLKLPDERLFVDLEPGQAAAMHFPSPCVLLIERQRDNRLPRFGLADEYYRQRRPQKGLITKLEARAISLAKLGLEHDSCVWDIGAGSGSVGLEASRIAFRGHVWAIEKSPDDAAIAADNARRLGTVNYSLIQGRAPQGLQQWPDPDAVFIGGSGGALEQLIPLCLQRLRPGGRLVMNFVTLENLEIARTTLQRLKADWELTQLQAARSRPLLQQHRLAAENPIWIITAHKETP